MHYYIPVSSYSLSALRRALEPDLPDKFPSRYLKVHQGWISLRLSEDSWVDYKEFEELFEHGEYSQALMALGRRAGAIRLYQKLCRSLEDELGVEPQQELQAYFQTILSS